eukprot:jgi/Galph1/641/GphlegSOOS_G5368.1
MASTSRPKQRYWPGKVPEYATRSFDDDDGEEDFDLLRNHRNVLKAASSQVEQNRTVASASLNGQYRPKDFNQGQNINTDVLEHPSEEGQDRRARIKAQVLQKRQVQPDLLDKEEERDSHFLKERAEEPIKQPFYTDAKSLFQSEGDSPASSSSSSEEDVDDEEDEQDSFEEKTEDVESVPKLFRAVFVTKDKRTTSIEREELEKKMEREKEAELLRKQQRKKEAQNVVAKASEESKNTLLATKAVDLDDNGFEMPDDADRESEYEDELIRWKIRELQRLEREQERDEARRKELEELERRRNLSEEERRKEDEERMRRDEKAREEKPKMAFLQKYYHKGVFFLEQDESGRYKEDIYNRNFMEATEEDLVDRTFLPKPMQTRRGQFGFKGRTKYTHLTDEDTTFGTGYGNKKLNLTRDEVELVRKRKASELKGSESVFDRPRGPKRTS